MSVCEWSWRLDTWTLWQTFAASTSAVVLWARQTLHGRRSTVPRGQAVRVCMFSGPTGRAIDPPMQMFHKYTIDLELY